MILPEVFPLVQYLVLFDLLTYFSVSKPLGLHDFRTICQLLGSILDLLWLECAVGNSLLDKFLAHVECQVEAFYLLAVEYWIMQAKKSLVSILFEIFGSFDVLKVLDMLIYFVKLDPDWVSERFRNFLLFDLFFLWSIFLLVTFGSFFSCLGGILLLLGSSLFRVFGCFLSLLLSFLLGLNFGLLLFL